MKPPREGLPARWHQDGHPWQERLGGAQAVTVWLAIDRATRENGCLRVLPGSHRLSPQPLRPNAAVPNLFDVELDRPSPSATARPLDVRPVTPRGQDGAVGSSLRFAAAVRALAVEARRLDLEVPGFRSPPRLAGADRSLRRRPGASPAVAVRLRDRPFTAIAADMVEGVVVANGLTGARADDVRRRLLAALADDAGAAAA